MTTTKRARSETSADDLQIGEVGLPELVGCSGLVFELIRRLYDDERRAGDEVVGLEQAIDGGLRVRLPGYSYIVRPSHWESARIKLAMLKARGETWLDAPQIRA